jgi:hypothetical protein
MGNSGTFIRRILPADANDIVLVADWNQILLPYKECELDFIVEHTIILEDFQAKIGLFSLLEAPWANTNALASDTHKEAELARIKTEGQKIFLGIYHAYGNGPWVKKAEEVLQNKNSFEQPWALMAPLFSTNTTAMLDSNLKIGVRIENKAQGVGGLKGSDYITIFGAWRKVTNLQSKKKDDDAEALTARVVSLHSEPNISFELAPPRNGNRRGFSIYNCGIGSVFISYSQAVSLSVYTVRIDSKDYFEISITGLKWQGSYWALGESEATLNITELLAD